MGSNYGTEEHKNRSEVKVPKSWRSVVERTLRESESVVSARTGVGRPISVTMALVTGHFFRERVGRW